MEALRRLGSIIPNWMRQWIDSERVRQKTSQQATATMQELGREFKTLRLQDAKNEVNAFRAHLDDLDDIIRRADAENARQRAKREGI